MAAAKKTEQLLHGKRPMASFQITLSRATIQLIRNVLLRLASIQNTRVRRILLDGCNLQIFV